MDLVAGRVQAGFISTNATNPHIVAGALRALAVSGTERSALQAGVPTVAESGHPGFDMGAWWGLVGQAKVPDDVVRKAAAAGAEVVLIDGWPEHVEAIRAHGLAIASPEGESLARPEAWHLAEAHRLRRLEPSAVFLATKLYDTEWSASLLAQWLAADVPVATMQNGLVEETVARIVGWGRTRYG